MRDILIVIQYTQKNGSILIEFEGQWSFVAQFVYILLNI